MEISRNRAVAGTGQDGISSDNPSDGEYSDPSMHRRRLVPVQVRSQEYVPPDGGYGWVCVGCVLLINAHTWGLNFVSSHMFQPRLSTAYQPH